MHLSSASRGGDKTYLMQDLRLYVISVCYINDKNENVQRDSAIILLSNVPENLLDFAERMSASNCIFWIK
jgi:hypothetical protein